MRDKLLLESLLEKLANKKLSGDEIGILSDDFKSVKSTEEIDRYFLKIWDQSANVNTELDSDLLLDNLHKRLDVIPAGQGKEKTMMIFSSLMKYAAIFVFAFILSWFIGFQYYRHAYLLQNVSGGNNEITVSYGSKSKIKLPDGSVVNLNSGSKLIYPAVFKDKSRSVILTGEAYFNVAADSVRPFFVHTSDITIKVLGTTFNVKSYPESNTIETTLVSGSLEISDSPSLLSGLPGLNRPLILKPNQKAVYIKDIDSLTVEDRNEMHISAGRYRIPKLSVVEKIDPQPLTAWKDNKLIFNNEKFEDLAVRLARWYNVKITIKSHELRKERFTGIFENETTEQVLNALKIAEPFDYTIDKNEIVIYNKEITP